MSKEFAPVAQLDRASVFGTEGWGFESLQTHQNLACRRVFYCGQGLMGLAHQTLLRLVPPFVGAGARLPLPVGGVKFSLDCVSLQTHQNLACRRVFYCGQGLMGLAHQTLLRLVPPFVGAGARLPLPVGGVKFSLDCVSLQTHQRQPWWSRNSTWSTFTHVTLYTRVAFLTLFTSFTFRSGWSLWTRIKKSRWVCFLHGMKRLLTTFG